MKQPTHLFIAFVFVLALVSAAIVMGHSTGAQLAALICTDDRYLKAEGLSLAEQVTR